MIPRAGDLGRHLATHPSASRELGTVGERGEQRYGSADDVDGIVEIRHHLRNRGVPHGGISVPTMHEPVFVEGYAIKVEPGSRFCDWRTKSLDTRGISNTIRSVSFHMPAKLAL